ncbi:MAG: Glycolate dehydrogenase, FAD-binding subunit GlcE [Ktedonobacterales bacterium]|jgi:glycolate oxidase FAD binding subunit|nr:MAG: Glycolate dehydrogenase, FAD-binding subunit GlcE [Ktedonobacterales bacterium]
MPPSEPEQVAPSAYDPRELAERLRRALRDEVVLIGEACQAYTAQGVTPQVVAMPTDVDGVSAALAVAAELGAAVVPWGSGSRQALGYPPRRYDLALSLTRLQQALAYDPADLTISVQAGITHARLAGRLAEEGQMLPLDVSLPERATLGGTLATATTGLRRARYGAPRDFVLGLRVVDAHGTITKTGGRVVKNVTGYDMGKLYLGSLGTLGVIVEANLKLLPAPETETTQLAIFPEPEQAFASLDALNALALQPAALVAVQVGAVPELVELAPAHRDYVLLAARLAGPAAAVRRAAREAEGALSASGARTLLTLDTDGHATFWSALERFAQAATRTPNETLLRVTALPAECERVIALARTAADTAGCALTWLADTAAGATWLRLHGTTGNTSDNAAFGLALDRVLQALLRHWKHVQVQDCPPALKRLLPIWGAESPAFSLMRTIKQSFDPAGLLNPGRAIGGL